MILKQDILDQNGNLDLNRLVNLLRELEKRDVIIDQALTNLKDKIKSIKE